MSRSSSSTEDDPRTAAAGSRTPADAGSRTPADAGSRTPADAGSRTPADAGRTAAAGSRTPADAGSRTAADAPRTAADAPRTAADAGRTAADAPRTAAAAGLLEVGRIGRPHGTRGEVTVTLVSNRPERLVPGSELQTDRGTLRVDSSRPHQRRHLVAFGGVVDRAGAEALRGLVLRAAPIDDPDEMWVHELIGARVIDQHGIDRGPLASVVDNPAGDLLELADGALVPARFMVGAPAGDVIVVDVPDGLLKSSSGSSAFG